MVTDNTVATQRYDLRQEEPDLCLFPVLSHRVIPLHCRGHDTFTHTLTSQRGEGGNQELGRASSFLGENGNENSLLSALALVQK
jgi:hypothetical protein